VSRVSGEAGRNVFSFRHRINTFLNVKPAGKKTAEFVSLTSESCQAASEMGVVENEPSGENLPRFRRLQVERQPLAEG
jgi:hypothetical protein